MGLFNCLMEVLNPGDRLFYSLENTIFIVKL